MRKLRALLRSSVLSDMDTTSKFYCYFAIDRIWSDCNQLVPGKRHIRSIKFTINSFSTQDCLRNFRFWPKGAQSSIYSNELLQPDQSTEIYWQSLYPFIHLFETACISMQAVGLDIFWNKAPMPSKVFWEWLESFMAVCRALPEKLKADLLSNRKKSVPILNKWSSSAFGTFRWIFSLHKIVYS